ncbi:MAG: lyase domain protein repeat-containing protein [Bryobacterales bacterium]|jgi:hypothetical protein|nr:lyase domain protein repeat-containing protein [Bryobacterales bacterium]
MTRWVPLAVVFASSLAFAQPSAPDTATPWETLTKGIQDGDPEHRQKAVSAVGTIGAVPEAVQLVAQALHDKNTLVRQKAAATLGEMGSPEAIPYLKAALDDGPEVSFTAAKSLWTLGDPDSHEILWQVMQGERKDTPGFLQGALRNAKHRLRPSELALTGAKEAAGLFGPASMGIEAAQEIVKATKEGSGAPGRVVVAEILAKDSDPYNVTLLEWALGDGSWEVRAAVAKALGECGNRETVPKLAPLLNDDRHAPRYMAAAAIIKLNLKFGAAGR